jgi:hypothetical protein
LGLSVRQLLGIGTQLAEVALRKWLAVQAVQTNREAQVAQVLWQA